jgi:hypothetical protein
MREVAMVAPFSGGCRCGAVRYTCAAEPLFAGHCHCRDCQYGSGGACATVVVVPRAAVTTTGTTHAYTVTAESGNPVTRRFCPVCGSPVFSESNNAAVLVIKAGSLDDPSWVKPMVHIWTESAQPWAEMSSELPKFERNPG